MPKEKDYAKQQKLDTHSTITQELHQIYDAKNSDYGNSYHRVRVDHGIEQFLIYAKSKINRIESISKKNGKHYVDESIIDSLRDLANYAIMEEIEIHMESTWERSELNDSDN